MTGVVEDQRGSQMGAMDVIGRCKDRDGHKASGRPWLSVEGSE